MFETEQTDDNCLCIGYEDRWIVTFVAVALQIIHFAVQALRNPMVHKLRIVVQAMNGSYAAGIKAHFEGELTDIFGCQRQVV